MASFVASPASWASSFGSSAAPSLAAGISTAHRRFLVALSALWLVGAGLIGAGRIGMAELAAKNSSYSPDVWPYVLIAVCPVLFLWAALALFASGPGWATAEVIAARGAALWRHLPGRWTSVTREQAQQHPLYGVNGWLLSLAGGLLLNILVRAAEFYTIMLPLSAGVPEWYRHLFNLTVMDFVVFSGLYLACFGAAMRHAPIFPLLLCITWGLDVLALLAFGAEVRTTDGMPQNVMAGFDLLLHNNVLKTLISFGLWFPYLLFSKRVNVTFNLCVRIPRG